MMRPEDLLTWWRAASRLALAGVASAAAAEATQVVRTAGIAADGQSLAFLVAAKALPPGHPGFDAAMTLIAIAADGGDMACHAVLLGRLDQELRLDRMKDWRVRARRSHTGRISTSSHRLRRRRSRWPEPVGRQVELRAQSC